MVCFTIEARQASDPVERIKEVLERKRQSSWLMEALVLPTTSLR